MENFANSSIIGQLSNLISSHLVRRNLIVLLANNDSTIICGDLLPNGLSQLPFDSE